MPALSIKSKTDVLSEVEGNLEREVEAILDTHHSCCGKSKVVDLSYSETYTCTRAGIESESVAELCYHEVIDTCSTYIEYAVKSKSETSVYFEEVVAERVLVADLATVTDTYTESSWLS